ncbi:MAG: hypothetical protein ABSG62_06835 [Terracidiphilus sp.]
MRRAPVPEAGTASPRAGQIHAAEAGNRAQRRFPVGGEVGGMAD